MITIRSTQKLAMSPEHGPCDVTREMVLWNEYNNFNKRIIRVDVIDRFIQEKVVNGITERIILSTKSKEEFYYTPEEIDAAFTSLGSDILTSGSFTGQLDTNKEIVLVAKTVGASDTGYHGMTTWAEDADPYVLVTEFSEEE